MFPKTYSGPFTRLLPRHIIALFGAHNLSNLYETNRQIMSPSQITIHDEWNPATMRYDADIAILTFDEEVLFQRFIKPICLQASTTELINQNGTVVGWGLTGDFEAIQSIPKQLKVPIYTNEICFLNNSNLALISSTRTFCAGSGNGTGVCFGDSGNGLFIKHEDKLYLKGIVSSSVVNSEAMCDVNTHGIFTNVLKFMDWTKSVLEQDISEFTATTKSVMKEVEDPKTAKIIIDAKVSTPSITEVSILPATETTAEAIVSSTAETTVSSTFESTVSSTTEAAVSLTNSFSVSFETKKLMKLPKTKLNLSSCEDTFFGCCSGNETPVDGLNY